MSQHRTISAAAVLCLVICAGCGGKSASDPETAPQGGDPGTKQGSTPPGKDKRDQRFELTSPTIAHRGAIPVTHTCDGEGTSPELTWDQTPDGTKSLVVIVTDPDVPRNFTHWILYNIPAELKSVPAGLPALDVLPEVGDARQGRNDFGKDGWGAPCPPAGMSHRYVIRLYAIDTLLDLPAGADRATVETAMEGHFRGQAAIIASYARKQ